MAHKRSPEAQKQREMKYAQRRAYTKLVFDTAHQDYLQGETVDLCSRDRAYEFLGQQFPMVLPGIIECDPGDVLVDSRGSGTFQQIRK
jgi:hypothetical protein